MKAAAKKIKTAFPMVAALAFISLFLSGCSATSAKAPRYGRQSGGLEQEQSGGHTAADCRCAHCRRKGFTRYRAGRALPGPCPARHHLGLDAGRPGMEPRGGRR